MPASVHKSINSEMRDHTKRAVSSFPLLKTPRGVDSYGSEKRVPSLRASYRLGFNKNNIIKAENRKLNPRQSCVDLFTLRT